MPEGKWWNLYHDGDLAKIYARCDFDPAEPVVVVSSHVDMVAERCYAKCDGELWKGSFDNLIANAVIGYDFFKSFTVLLNRREMRLSFKPAGK